LTYANPQALLVEMRQWGANLAPQRHAGLRGRHWLRQLHEALAAGADAQGRIGIDIELVYGHAFRAPDRGPAVSEQTTIGLHDMKMMLRRSGARK
jgi:malonyl-CoA O-methyltransferase